MGSPLENPVIRYGMTISSAAIIVFVAFFFLEGIARWVALGVAVLEVTVVPQVLKLAATQEAA